MRWILPFALLPLFALGSAPTRRPLDEFVIAQVVGSADADAGRAVLVEAYSRLGVTIRFETFTAAEALAASSSGRVAAELQRIDGTQLAFPSLIQVPIPINYIEGGVFSSHEGFPIRGWNSLRPYRIGIVRGIRFAELGTGGMDVRVADSYEQLFNWIAGEQVDVGVMPRVNGLHLLGESEIEGIRALPGVLETLFLYHYVHESRSETAARLTPVLKEMLLDGTTRRLCSEACERLLHEDS